MLRFALLLSAILAVAAADCSKCEPGPCTNRAVCVDDECLYSYKAEGAQCNNGAGKCVRGSCSAPLPEIVRRAESAQPMIETVENNLHIVTSEGDITLKGNDVIFSIAERRVGNAIELGAEFSVVTLKKDLEDSINSLKNETESNLESVQTDLVNLENSVNTKVKADLEEISAKLNTLDQSVKRDVQVKLDGLSNDVDDAIAKSDTADAATASAVDDLSTKVGALEAAGSLPVVYSMDDKPLFGQTIRITPWGGDDVILSGSGFTSQTTVKIVLGGKTVKPAAIRVDAFGTTLTVTTPKLEAADPCKGGDGKDQIAAFRIYAKEGATKYVERSAIVGVTITDYGEGTDGDFEVTGTRKWNAGILGAAYSVVVPALKTSKRAGEVVSIQKVQTHQNVDTSNWKCGTKVLIINMGDFSDAEPVGSYAYGTVKTSSKNNIELQAAAKVSIKSFADANHIIIQRVPQFKTVTFKNGNFQARKANFMAKDFKATGFVTYTGIVAFAAQTVDLEKSSNGAAVVADFAGYTGGAVSGNQPQDARHATMGGGSNGQNANPKGCGHNRRGGYGGAGCGDGKAGHGGNSGGGWAYGGYNGRSKTNDPRGGGGGGGADYSCSGAGGGGSHCSGLHYSKATGSYGFNTNSIKLTLGGGAAAGAGGGTSSGQGGYANGLGGKGGRRVGGNGGAGYPGGGIVMIAAKTLKRANGLLVSANGGKGGAGGGGSGGTHKNGGGGGGQGANGGAGGSVLILSGDSKIEQKHVRAEGGDGGGGGGGAGVPSQHNPSASGGGGAGAGPGGGGGGGAANPSHGGRGGNAGQNGEYNSGGRAGGGGGGCTGQCGGRYGNANKGGYSSSTSCNKGKDASGLNAGNGGEANGCGGDGNRGGGGAGGGSGGPGKAGFVVVM